MSGPFDLRGDVRKADMPFILPVARSGAELQAALNGASADGRSVVNGGGRTYEVTSAIEIPAGVELEGATLVNAQSGASSILLVNSRSKIAHTVKLIGTGVTSVQEKGVYPATDNVVDVECDADISNLTTGIWVRSPTTGNLKGWKIGGHIHDIVGTTGASEGYGVLMGGAQDCKVTSRLTTIKRHAVYVSVGSTGNLLDVSVDGCEHAAVNVYATAAQETCARNVIRGSFRNLTYDGSAGGGGGAVSIIENSDYNDVQITVNATGSPRCAIWIEGVGSNGRSPRGNNVHDCLITGTYYYWAIRLLEANRTTVRNNSIDGTFGASVIFTTSNNTGTHGGYIERNLVHQATSTRTIGQASGVNNFYFHENIKSGGTTDFSNSGSGANGSATPAI